MHGPWWPPDVFAGVMVLVSAYCSLRLLVTRRWRRRVHVDINVAHVTMGVAMAGMLVPSLATLPTGVWEVVFGGLGLWFALRSAVFVRRHLAPGARGALHSVSHYLTHLVMAGGMLYMYAAGTSAASTAVSGSMSMAGAPSGTGDFVALPLFFTAVLVLSAVWHVDHLSPVTGNPVVPEPVALAARTRVTPGLGRTPSGTGAWGTAASAPAARAAGGAGDRPAVGDEWPWLAPRLEALCHVAMCVTMGYMLVLML